MRVRRRIATAALMAAALSLPTAAGVVVVGSAPALAASCTGSGCIGKDPHSTNCDTAGTVKTVKHKDIAEAGGDGTVSWSVDLRHSSGCKSYWARGTADIASIMTIKIQKQCLRSTEGYYNCGTYTKQVGSVDSQGYKHPKTGTYWTKMEARLSSSERIRACLSVSWAGYTPSPGYHCTGWYPS